MFITKKTFTTSLEMAVKIGEAIEQRRIVELLEGQGVCTPVHAQEGTCYCKEIALIEGNPSWTS
jgi:hypothetical protein